MKLSLLFCFLSLFLAISCGSDNDDDDNGTVNTPTTNEDDRQNEENDDVVSRYTAVVLETESAQSDDSYNYTLRADLGRRPVLLTGNFSHTPVAQDGTEGTPAACSFAVTLTEAQADSLERLGNKLKVCKHQAETGNEVVDFEYTQMISLTGRNGGTAVVEKYSLGDVDTNYSWLCGGRSAFYSRMKSLVRNKLPANCPAGALRKI